MAKQTESTELRAKRRDRERDKIKAQSSRRRKPGCLYGPIFVVVSLQAKRKHASGGVWHRPRHFEDRMDTNCTAPSPIPHTFAKKNHFSPSEATFRNSLVKSTLHAQYCLLRGQVNSVFMCGSLTYVLIKE